MDESRRQDYNERGKFEVGGRQELQTYVKRNVFQAAGDLIYATAAGIYTRLGIGSSGKVLGVSGGVPAWITDPTTDVVANAGDLIYGTGADAVTNLAMPAGSTYILSANSGLTAPQWKQVGVSINYYFADDTWTKPTGLIACFIRAVGGGGGGGGAQVSGALSYGAGSGGGGGGYAEAWKAAAALGSTETVTIGTAGSAGANTGGNGGNGGASSFGSHVTIGGGVGGLGSTGVTILQGGAGGYGSAAGDYANQGGPGGNNLGDYFSGKWIGGNGGASLLGMGGQGGLNDAAGQNGTGSGGGGGGAASNNNNQRLGGAGKAGCVLVWNFTVT